MFAEDIYKTKMSKALEVFNKELLAILVAAAMIEYKLIFIICFICTTYNFHDKCKKRWLLYVYMFIAFVHRRVIIALANFY